MRIALLTRRFDPAGGGTERDLMVTAECLRRAGHELTIYAGEVRGPASDLIVREIGGARLPRALALARFGFGAPGAARRAGADLVLSFARVADADVMRSGGGAHISYLRAARRWHGRMAGAAMRLAPYHQMQMLLERRAFRSPRLRLTIAVSNLVRDDLIDVFKLAPARVATLYNGVDLQRFHPPSDPREHDEVRAHFKIPRDVALAVFIGNGFARKGVGGLVEAWRMLSGAPHLLVVGADRALEAYRRRADELGVGQRITFAGA
jgi:UDP-glucose:(heptosyl)LPS alpha-1,3-glucosyltransferase